MLDLPEKFGDTIHPATNTLFTPGLIILLSMIEIQQFASQLIANLEQVILDKRSVIELLAVSLLCEGHILLEDVPDTRKTMLARSIAVSMGGEFMRLRCTPDLLPNDVTGLSVYHPVCGQYEFRLGPVFVNVLLADLQLNSPLDIGGMSAS